MRYSLRHLAPAVLTAASLLAFAAAPAKAEFGFKPGEQGFSASVLADGGEAATLAGSHPYQLGFEFGFNASGPPGAGFPDGDLRDLEIGLPPGMLLNPSAVSTCAASIFATPRQSPFDTPRSGENCPAASQVGTVEILTSEEGGALRRFGVFNLASSHGVAAQLGFGPYGSPIVLDANLNRLSAGRYNIGLKAQDVPQALDIHGIRLILWGTPWGVSHNGERGRCLNEAEPDFPWAKCSVGHPGIAIPEAFVTMPIECSDALSFTATARSWQGGSQAKAVALNRDASDQEVGVEGCDSVQFDPRPAAFLTTNRASSPAGFQFRLAPDVSGVTVPARRSPSAPRQIVLELPSGTTVNPAVGAGLGVCSRADFARESALSAPGRGCPDSSRIGEFSATTPLFADDSLKGSVYLAQPNDPFSAGSAHPFDSLLALYLVTRLPERGLIIKLAGRLDADPVTGDLTATFNGLPQLPYTGFQLDLRSGNRSFLASPPRCGDVLAKTTLTAWTGGDKVIASTPSEIGSGYDSGACPTGTPPFNPEAITGGVNAQVGAYTPYFVRLSREDNEQEITSYSLDLPKGITAKLAGIPFCSDAAIRRARSRSGFAETRDPSCPSASRVGRVNTGYGVGQALAYAPARVYLAGPYKGRPLSLVTINAATIGPIDLGTYVIRSAFALDRRTAKLEIDARASDPIPHMVEGIPLHVRDIRIHIDRHRFTRNPSSCEASQMLSTLTGSGVLPGDPSDDTTVRVRRHFQLFNCAVLGFRPRLGLSLRGGVRRGAHPSLRANFISRGPRDSSLKHISVAMPHSLFLAQNHIRGICTRAQFAAESCPRNSVYGRAAAHTELFDEPLRGLIYLKANGGERPLPDLVATLRSGEIRIDLEGRIGSSKRGGIRVSFMDLPDAPIDRFAMVMHGGRQGLLVNSVNVCAAPPKAAVKALGQNNRGAIFSSRLRGQGCTRFKQKLNQRKRARIKAQRQAKTRARRAALTNAGRPG